MAPTDQETEVVPPAEEPEEMPLPSDPKVIFLGGLFVLALLAAAYVASEIVLPLVFAIILKLLLQPASRILERLHVPRILAALLLILVLFGTIVGLGTAISGPAGTWAAKLPEDSAASGAAEFHARTHQYTATVFAAGGRFWRQGTITKCGRLGARPNSSDEAIHGDPELCQRLLHDGAVSFFPSRVWRYSPAPPCRDTAPLQQQAPGSRNLAANRKRHLRLSGHDHDHERGSRYCYGIGDVAHGGGRPDPLGDGGLSAELCADPRHCFGRVDLSSRRPVDHRLTLASAASCGALPWISFDRGRDYNADASGQTVHPQSRPRHHLARFLVLGHSGRDPLCAHAGGY